MRLRLVIVTLAALAVTAPPASAQDGLIVFESERDGPLTEIYAMRPDGSAKTRLTYNAARDISAEWSPDGAEIAFSRGVGNWELFRMAADGSRQEQLTYTPQDELNPVWAPDGRRVAFERQSGGVTSVHVLDLDTREESIVAAGASTPAWSPVRDEVAYAVRNGARLDVAVTDLDSGSTRQMTHNAVDDVGPSWSPDGEQLLFSRRAGWGSQLVVMDADGGGGGERMLPTGSADAFSASWAPSGEAIAFSTPSGRDRRYEGQYEIVRLDLATGAVSELTTSFPGRDVAPDWGATEATPMARAAQVPADPPVGFCTKTGNGKANKIGGTNFTQDVLCGKAGNDKLTGRGKADLLQAGTGDDRVFGGGGSDNLVTRGDGGGDVLNGGTGADAAWTDCGDTVTSAVFRCG